jgi:hypothetical protein
MRIVHSLWDSRIEDGLQVTPLMHEATSCVSLYSMRRNTLKTGTTVLPIL